MAAEFTQALLQTVGVGQNVLLSDTAVKGNRCIRHRQGSGVVTLKAGANQCRALYKVTFGGNISIPTGGTVDPISLAISIEGEPLATSTMTVTPAAAEELWNVFSAAIVDVPCGCCVTVAVRNTSDQAIDVTGANLIVDRIA